MNADLELIKWLLFESKQSINKIHKESGVPLTTVNDLYNKRSKVERMRFDNAAKLTAYARVIKNNQ